jgi:rRNA-processing protein FCF1
MTGINLTWGVSSGLDESEVKAVLKKFGCTDEKPTNQYQKWVCKGVNVTIIRFEKNLVVQGKENDESLQLVRELSKVNGLRLDKENAEKFAKLFRVLHNAIFCMECNTSSMLIEGKIEGLDIVFRKECGHKNSMQPPLFMLTSRILPDVNILIGGHLSRCIDLGYFEGFEVVIPEFVTHVIGFLGSIEASGASNEIARLRKFESEGRITIFNCKDGLSIPSTKEEFQRKEDDYILAIANLTNSILFTGDKNLKDKATLNKRPTIYFQQKESKQLKIIHEVRSP